jgi:hypothetical protein
MLEIIRNKYFFNIYFLYKYLYIWTFPYIIIYYYFLCIKKIFKIYLYIKNNYIKISSNNIKYVYNNFYI